MSEFARARNAPGLGKTYFSGGESALLNLVRTHWHERVPGDGHTDLEHVVKVSVPPDGFFTPVLERLAASDVVALRERRREHEEAFVGEYARGGTPAPAQFAEVVLYSRQHLARTGEPHDSRVDWQIVALSASPSPRSEPMSPYTMARNQLELPGGSRAAYSGDAYARAIVYWEEHVRLMPDVGAPVEVLAPSPGRPTEILRMAHDQLAGTAAFSGRAFAEAIVSWHRAALRV